MTLKKPILKITIWVDEKGNIIKNEVEDSKTPESERKPIQIKGYQFVKTVIENGITKHIYKKEELLREPCEPSKHCKSKEKEETENKYNKDCSKSEYKDENQKLEKKNEHKSELPETGNSQINQKPALMMLLAGLRLLGLYRKKIKD
ncbi:LPXTG cell wall anchor domain-containing protein [Staphylococcus saccharolyticus]|uniref:LPXTG cell wall anchor domain-containing protein n=1 Tax=Staphylococcus saccharolyticus TaxID=33028 RepID=UPI00102D7405|nr:LPXTG cell wall anchor domain-containing protein [Staphylococcus saccharolyticus]QRJ67229.1 LPXTG cell wall anchor domain-containing protein [Staphylococcus saccharolyticus]